MIVTFAKRKPIRELFLKRELTIVAALSEACDISAKNMGADAKKLFSKRHLYTQARDKVA